MNKTKKIVAIAVSAVMAGSLAFAITGCTPTDKLDTPKKEVIKPLLDENGKLKYAQDTVINTSIGYNSANTGMKYKAANEEIVGKKMMGKSWSDGDLKPAWAALQTQLGVKFEDKWTYAGDSGKASANLTTVKDTTGLDKVDIFTASLNLANAEGTQKAGNLLNLADYLDYMPNYKNFLKSDIIQMSLMATRDGAMYIAPYFDGNDDVEKFVLMRKDIVEKMLDKDLPATGDSTFASQGGKNKTALAATSVEAFFTEDYTVDTTDPAALDQESTPIYGTDKTVAKNKNTVKVKVNYTAALTAAKTSGSALNTALLAAKAGLDVTKLANGNIITLMNAVLEGNMEVSGTKLINILRAYIDVAYTNEAGTAFYTADNKLNRSGVFNSACAAWDVDLYVALGRCYVASGSMFSGLYTADATKPMYLLSGRTNDDQRQSDMYSLVGELYGVRGLESRYNYSYVNKDGKVVDTRTEEATWEAMNKFSALVKEGLVNITADSSAGLAGGDYGNQRGTYETLSLHDYVQTQTKVDGFKTQVTSADYNMAPVMTPVSKWDDGTGAKYMRFTESWRSVKTEGMAVSSKVTSNPEKLAAVLAMIDYIYSPDGQILMTYGPQSTNGNATDPNGLWYATEATESLATVATEVAPATQYAPAQYEMKADYKDKYFVYNGKVYTGTAYNGRQIPTMTTENLKYFAEGAYNFTNHARRTLGTCFPVGNKDQGFEYQCTAKCGLAGSDIFNIGLYNDTIKHQYQTVDKNNLWYMLMPTSLPFDSTTNVALGGGNLQYISGLGGKSSTLYCKEGKQHANFFLKFMATGFTKGGVITINKRGISIDNAKTIVDEHANLGMANLTQTVQLAFDDLMTWYDARNQAK